MFKHFLIGTLVYLFFTKINSNPEFEAIVLALSSVLILNTIFIAEIEHKQIFLEKQLGRLQAKTGINLYDESL
jgi:hypothetical protein